MKGSREPLRAPCRTSLIVMELSRNGVLPSLRTLTLGLYFYTETNSCSLFFLTIYSTTETNRLYKAKARAIAAPLRATEALGVRGAIAPIHLELGTTGGQCHTPASL
jgi:hypothetical protein